MQKREIEVYRRRHLTIGAIAATGTVLMLFTFFLAMIGGILALTLTPLGGLLESIHLNVPIGAFFDLEIRTGIQTNLLVLCWGIMVIFALCFVAGIRNENGVIWGLRQLREGHVPVGIPNWLTIMPLLSSGLLVIVLALTFLLAAGGVSSGGLPTPPTPQDLADEFAAIIYAPIREEMAFRITVIGILDGIFLLARRWWNDQKAAPQTSIQNSRSVSLSIGQRLTALLLAIYSPEMSKKRFGLPRVATHSFRGIHWSEWILIVVTSFLFGIAHVLSGIGWDWGKAVTAALTGFVLGIVFVMYAAYANILVHWFFNFYIYVFTLSFFTGGLRIGALLIDFVSFLLILFMGVLAIIVSTVWLVDSRRRFQPPPPPPMPYMTQQPPTYPTL